MRINPKKIFLILSVLLVITYISAETYRYIERKEIKKQFVIDLKKGMSNDEKLAKVNKLVDEIDKNLPLYSLIDLIKSSAQFKGKRPSYIECRSYKERIAEEVDWLNNYSNCANNWRSECMDAVNTVLYYSRLYEETCLERVEPEPEPEPSPLTD